MSGQNIFGLTAQPAPALTPIVQVGTSPTTLHEAFAPLLAQAALGGGNLPGLTDSVQPQAVQDTLLMQGTLLPFWPVSTEQLGSPVENEIALTTDEEISPDTQPTGEETAAYLPVIQQILAQVSQGSSVKSLDQGDLAKITEALAQIPELKENLNPKQMLALAGLIQDLAQGQKSGESINLNPAVVTGKGFQAPETAKPVGLTNNGFLESPPEVDETHCQVIQKLKDLLKEQNPDLFMDEGQNSVKLQETPEANSLTGTSSFMELISPQGITKPGTEIQGQQSTEKAVPMPAALRENVFDQVVRSMNLSIKEGQSEMQIHLKPDFLGQMSMKIAVEDGLIVASFTVENHQVKELLESSLSNLRQSLTNQGLKVDTLTVNIGGGGSFSDLSRRQSNWADLTPKNRTTGEYREAETDIAQVNYDRGRGWTTSSMDYIV